MPTTHQAAPLSPVVEDFLKAVFEVSRAADGSASTSALAEALDVTPATVTAMAKRLAEAGLVDHAPYRGVTLTAPGRRIAVETIRHHRLVETYLHEALGVPWDQLHAEAERWEHVLSEDLEQRMDAALGHPTHDPHGSPIPSPELHLAETDWPTLASLRAGQRARVAEVEDGDAALLRYLGGLGLYPGTGLEVTEGPPYAGGPVTVRLTDGPHAGAEHAVGDRAAEAVSVEVLA